MCLCAVCSYKSRGVIVLDSLGVAKGLQYGVGLQQLSLQLALRHTGDVSSASRRYKDNSLSKGLL